MIKKVRWAIFAFLAIAIGLYPLLYLLSETKVGILQTKSAALLANTLWITGFYAHIVFGGLALLVGWPQFSPKIRNRHLNWHRTLGKLYVLFVMLSAPAAVGIGFFATGGWVPALGFILLGLVWFGTTLSAYLSIRAGKVQQHESWMVYSYAACFAAVTLRLWLPVLVSIFANFNTAYAIVAWLCWVPNMLIAYLIVRKNTRRVVIPPQTA